MLDLLSRRPRGGGSRGRWRPALRCAAVASAISLLLLAVFLFDRTEFRSRAESLLRGSGSGSGGSGDNHPIDRLMRDAHAAHERLLRDERSLDLGAAAARYRARRGRHPPPGFDAWAAHALARDAVLVESFFDRIYADLAPFWGLDARATAERAARSPHVVRVRRGGNMSTSVTAVGGSGTPGAGPVPWLELWTDLVREAAPHLPDVDMPVNYMDEPRLLVPWEEVAALVAREREGRGRGPPPVDEVLAGYTGLAGDARGRSVEEGAAPYEPAWRGGDYWELTRAACAPSSPSRNVSALASFAAPPAFPGAGWDREHLVLHGGFVRNATAARDPCGQPHLRGLHGTFVEPLTVATSVELAPLFGGCKLEVNNDILIPGAMYLTDDPMYSGGEGHGPPWPEKRDGLVWRGVASGGRNKAENWAHFQRHRLVEMLNGTTVASLEEQEIEGGEAASDNTPPIARTFALPPRERYDTRRLRTGTLGRWLRGFADVGFTDLLCFPADSDCGYVRPWLSTVARVPMEAQYAFKFAPDVDGNSFSARFRGLLWSTSLPLKATVYAEWHDDRLAPWLHYAPVDNTLQDLYGLLDFFTRDRRGDRAARLIAEEGRAWAARVLRRDDMLLYVWRLLLEFARVCDEKRDYLGFVDDLR
ncbi:glycosyltransferase family 90 protein [Xylariaceae sp. FL0804]|nr:glycosyltransferase family 90 protein [Xylariaceae sp. FL0804]